MVPTFYGGSPERLSFNEEGHEPGFWIHYTGDKSASQFVRTPARKFYTLGFPWSDEDPDAVVEVLTDLQNCLTGGGELESPVKDAIVRVRYECTDAQAKLINQSQITRDLYDLGAYYVQGVEAKVRRTTRTRAAEADAGMMPYEALSMWGRVNEVPEEELQELKNRAFVLCEEVGV